MFAKARRRPPWRAMRFTSVSCRHSSTRPGRAKAPPWPGWKRSRGTLITRAARHRSRARRDKLIAAQQEWSQPGTPSRVLLVCGAARNDGTCPGEISKTFRLVQLAREVLQGAGLEVELLDLSRL